MGYIRCNSQVLTRKTIPGNPVACGAEHRKPNDLIACPTGTQGFLAVRPTVEPYKNGTQEQRRASAAWTRTLEFIVSVPWITSQRSESFDTRLVLGF
jgi:hypothetical protein